ncbi:hypothetical protein ACTXT7_012234 [Hymenolepis weldensis]
MGYYILVLRVLLYCSIYIITKPDLIQDAVKDWKRIFLDHSFAVHFLIDLNCRYVIPVKKYSPIRTVSSLHCFNSVKINGLGSVEQAFIPNANLLSCSNCGVLFTRDKAHFHYDISPNCRQTGISKVHTLPYHALEMYQCPCDELQQSKRSLKRSKTESMRQKRPVKTSSHPQLENNSAAINSNHSRKRPSSKSKITCHPGLVGSSLERDKFSSSSSYDRLSCGEVNSPGSGTESSCSAPSKLVENPPSALPVSNLFENLEKDFAPSAPKMRRVGGYNPSQSRSVSSLLNDHPQSYPSSPASPHIDPKEATYVPPSVHSSRKQVSIKTDNQGDHPRARVSSRQPPQQQAPNDSQYHGKMRSQFDSFTLTSFNSKQQNHHNRLPQHCQTSPETNSVETVDLVSDDGSQESDYEIPNFYIPTDKSISYHSDQPSQYSLDRQQASRSSSILRNGSKSGLQDYTHLTKIDKSWDPPNLTSSPDFWNSRNYKPVREGRNYYDNFESMRSKQADKRASYAMHNQTLRNSSIFEQASKDMVLGQSQRQNDTEINLLKQCGCVEMGDVRCKNTIFCQDSIPPAQDDASQRQTHFSFVCGLSYKLEAELRREAGLISLKHLPVSQSSSSKSFIHWRFFMGPQSCPIIDVYMQCLAAVCGLLFELSGHLLERCPCGSESLTNGILIHTWEEKKLVQRPRELKEILNNFRHQQKILGM